MKQLGSRDIDDYIPGLVKDVVNANKNFSNVGFGPISAKSSNLYAGRWVDQTTGRVRILPKASK